MLPPIGGPGSTSANRADNSPANRIGSRGAGFVVGMSASASIASTNEVISWRDLSESFTKGSLLDMLLDGRAPCFYGRHGVPVRPSQVKNARPEPEILLDGRPPVGSGARAQFAGIKARFWAVSPRPRAGLWPQIRAGLRARGRSQRLGSSRERICRDIKSVCPAISNMLDLRT